MSGLLIWILLGVVVYMLFSRKGGMGMGCCGGHHDHESTGPPDADTSSHKRQSSELEDNIIDLKKEDYKVISHDGHQAQHENL